MQFATLEFATPVQQTTLRHNNQDRNLHTHKNVNIIMCVLFNTIIFLTIFYNFTMALNICKLFLLNHEKQSSFLEGNSNMYNLRL